MNAKVGLQNWVIEKYVATGNDFLFFTEPSTNKEFSMARAQINWSSLAKSLCDRQNGLGADGLISMEVLNADPIRVRWHFFNADGSSAEMCGNAARCVGEWAKRHLFKNKTQQSEIHLETGAGVVHVSSVVPIGELSSDNQVNQMSWWKVQMTSLTSSRVPTELSTLLSEFKSANFVNSGVPHLVLEVGDRSQIEHYRLLAAKLRAHPCFGKAGTNVSFFAKTERGIFCQSFERGVEEFTLACGTGVVAAAHSYKMEHLQSNLDRQSVAVRTPGGALEVAFENNQSFLIGPAIKIYSIHPEQIDLL